MCPLTRTYFFETIFFHFLPPSIVLSIAREVARYATLSLSGSITTSLGLPKASVSHVIGAVV